MIARKILIPLLLLASTSAGASSLDLDHWDERKLAIGISVDLLSTMGLSIVDLKRFNEYSITGYNYGKSGYRKPANDYNGAEKQFHLRRFFKKQIGGFYYGAFLHRTTLEGKLKDRYKSARQTKHGLGVEIGYTSYGMFKTRRLYWGTGLGISRYIGVKETDIFENPRLKNDKSYGMFYDIFRIGLVF